MPTKTVRSGKRNVTKYPWPEIYRWHIEQVERRARETAKSSVQIDEARRRKVVAEAELAELELAEKKHQLLTVDQFRAHLTDALERVAGQLLTMPVKLAPLVVGMKSLAKAKAVIKTFVRELMDELYAGHDVNDRDAA